MSALHTSLSQSFRRVPPAAVPALLDCVLSSTADSPSLLFDFLLSDFSNLIKEICSENKKLSSEECAYLLSYMRGLCHLLKKISVDTAAFERFTWEAFIPSLEIIQLYEKEILHEIVQCLLELICDSNSWDLVEKTFIPFLLRSVTLSMGVNKSEDTLIILWNGEAVFLDIKELLKLGTIYDSIPHLPLTLLCYILSSLLEAATENCQSVKGYSTSTEVFYAETFGGHLLWNLCNLTIQMFSQSSEHRSCTVGLLLPSLFKAFMFNCSVDVCVQGISCHISRQQFFMNLWNCARMLFATGSTERRDAYGIISLYLSYFSCVNGDQVEIVDRAEGFDIRAEKDFWDEMKHGLVDKEGYIRKQSLHILKRVLFINGGEQNSNVSERKPHHKGTVPHGMTKRDLWAEEEAHSLGVRTLCVSDENGYSLKQKWEAFILLYEMLEEYGTHLVEAAWNHQIMVLLHSSTRHESLVGSSQQVDVFGGNFNWLAILWERGLFHDNPLVRCHIMKSFLEIDWKSHNNCREMFPEDFLLGAFMHGLNDPVHHKDFGLKGVHCSRTIDAASKFFHQYCRFMCRRERISFLNKLASVAREQSLSRAGLMSLSQCIISASNSSSIAAAHTHTNGIFEGNKHTDVSADVNGLPCTDKLGLIDSLRFLIENSKQHFNRNFRFRVCEDVVEAAMSVVFAHELPLESVLHFLGAVPREFIDKCGSLRSNLQSWLAGNDKQDYAINNSSRMHILHSLCEFPRRFMSCHCHSSGERFFDDDDLVAWFAEAERWTRILFLVVEEEPQLQSLLKFIEGEGANICQQSSLEGYMPVKFLILLWSITHELELMQQRKHDQYEPAPKTSSNPESVKTVEKSHVLLGKFVDTFLVIMEDLISLAEVSCAIFWADIAVDNELPGSVTGKLGGPSQRRLSSPMRTSVLQAIVSVRTLAAVSSWCAIHRNDASLSLSSTYLWKFFQKVVTSPIDDTEASAEVRLAAYEALSFVLKASGRVISSSAFSLIREMNNSLDPVAKDELILDSLALTFVNHINDFLSVRQLARSRKAVLMNWKWLCLEAILSIPYHAVQNGVQLGHGDTFFSDNAVRFIYTDLVESLENAGEGSVLPMLRSVRMLLDLLTSSTCYVSSCHGVNVQMIWQLVRSSWILHTSCNKRRVAPIAALLSSVLHVSIFKDEDMHVAGDAPGPLKWFCEKILEEGTKSPRTIRLAALHLTGLWLSYPGVIKYYMKELKLLTLYGSVAFDEDFEAELLENVEAKSEVSLLAKSSDPEMTEAFINTELYARVSIAVLFNKLADLADLVEHGKQSADCCAALDSGKSFLLELLDSAVNDKDLSKELYKKYSAIHRRKVRAWQMICVLSRFVRRDIVHRVIDCLSICLYRNNLPAVRQYLETFAIRVYLNFPFMVKEHLVPILCDYDMKTQALSSYVFIAANIMLHAKAEVQLSHLDELLPPLIPLLTSHHHTLRGFTQLLVYQVLCKLLPALKSSSNSFSLEQKCFGHLKTYLAQNPDCVRLRASMEGYLDTFCPDKSITPAGIFSNRVEDVEFECVPMSLMEKMVNFLNDVREELRSSMANDDVTLKNESLLNTDGLESLSADARNEMLLPCPSTELSFDFQKKFTLSKHDMLHEEMEKEDQLLEQILHSRIASVEKMKANRQQIILVASLLDRIPNLAGLARTCEVFKASGLALADISVLKDKQFQLISVTAEKWVPIIEVPVQSVKNFLEKKKREGFSILGLEQTANSVLLDKFSYPQKTVLVLGREKEGIPADIIHVLDACIEIPQLGVVRSLNVHVSGAIAIWEYTRQQRSKQLCV